MMRLPIGARVGLVLVAVATGVFVFDRLQHQGRFKHLQPHSVGDCTAIGLGAPAEDIRIDSERRIAYLTHVERRGAGAGASERGTVTLLDLNGAEPRPRAALSTAPESLVPEGIALYAPPQGARRLFVLTRGSAEERAVVIFEEASGGGFVPLETIRDPLLAHANSIAAVGPREFYAAHGSGARGAFERLQERFLRRGLSTVTYFDGARVAVVADGLHRARGIAVSNHGLWVYVGEPDADRLQIFDRDSATGALEPRNRVALASAPDNVTIDADGTVWIAAHPKRHALDEHLEDPSTPAPTAIYRLRTSMAEKEDRVTIPYLDLGKQMSAGSVAAVVGDLMLIGSRTQRKVLLCELPENL